MTRHDGTNDNDTARQLHARRNRTHALVLLALAAPVLAALQRSPDLEWLPTPATSNALIAYPVVLLTAGLVYLRWSTTRARVDGWLVAVLVFVGVQGLGLPVLTRGLVPLPDERGAWFALLDVAVALTVLGAIGLCERVDLRPDPFVTGTAAGLALVGLRALTLELAPAWHLPASTGAWLSGVLIALNVAIGWRVLHLRTLAEAVRVRLAGTAVLLGIGMTAASSASSGSVVAATVALTSAVACAVLLVTATVGMLLRWFEEESSLALLHRQVSDLQADRRSDRALMHEVNATLAGLTSASTLMQPPLAVTGSRRAALEAMMQSELHRLQRLLADDPASAVVRLDEALPHLLAAHGARGHTVHWRPSGLASVAGSDAVVETVNILLDNACRHGSPQSWVTARGAVGRLAITVSDAGPGIAPEVVEGLFDWGVRGPASSGQGTGLSIARELVLGLGGTLRLDHSSDRGSSFTVLLPLVEVAPTASAAAPPTTTTLTDHGYTACTA